MPYAGEIAGLTTAFCWAISAFLWSDVGRRASPLAVNAFKSVAGVILLTLGLTAAIGEVWPALPFRAMALLAASGIIGLAIGDACIFTALKLMGPRRSLVMGLLTAPLSAVLGLIVLKEAIPPMGWLGMGCTLAGIGIVQTESSEKEGVDRRALVLGSLAGFAAALCTSVGSLLTKQVLTEGARPVQVAQLRLTAAGLVLVIVGLAGLRLRVWFRPFMEREVLGKALAATVIGTAAGLVLMTFCISKIEIGLASTVTSTAPLFAVPLAVIVKRERVSATAVVGTVVAVAGIALMFLRVGEGR